MDKKLWQLMVLLQRSETGRFIAKLLYASKIIAIYHFFMLEYERKHPTDEMKEARIFFGGGYHRERIKKCTALLSDDQSKKTFKNAILFRMTHNYRDRPAYTKKDQYFPKDIVRLHKKEVFIDCGAYIGDTVVQFLKASGNQYKKIVAFEPDPINIKSLKKTAKNIVIVKAAVWNCETKLSFDGANGAGSCVNQKNAVTRNVVKATAIDNISACADASFIKMDIEGSEYYALQGAYHTICKNKPTLAICIYHSDEDMLRIIELIHSWQLGYKLYVRHHGQRTAETVLYAVQ